MARDGANSLLHGGPADGLCVNVPVTSGELHLPAVVTLDPTRYGERGGMPVVSVYTYQSDVSAVSAEHHWKFKGLKA